MALTDSFPLERFGHNLTSLAQQGKFPSLIGYDTCIRRIFQILLRRENSNNKYTPLLLSLDEGSRWRIVAEVVRRMAIGAAPAPLPNWQVVALNYEALLSNLSPIPSDDPLVIRRRPSQEEHVQETASADTTEENLLERLFSWPSLEQWDAPSEVLSRLQALLLAIQQADEHLLLFVDQFHWLLGGGPQQDALDASPLLKPALARREIHLFGACTPAQYRQYIERDAAIARRMQAIDIQPDETLQRG